MFEHSVLVLLVAVVFALTWCSAIRPIVTVYYEAIDPYTMDFIHQQLLPTMESDDLPEEIRLTMVPFGRGNFTTLRFSELSINCFHGPPECYLSKQHVCGIKYIEGPSFGRKHVSKALDFIACMMQWKVNNFAYPVHLGRKCADDTRVKVDAYRSIEHCVNSTEGSQLLWKMAEKTAELRPTLNDSPIIVFQEKYNPEESNRAIDNFRDVLNGYFAMQA